MAGALRERRPGSRLLLPLSRASTRPPAEKQAAERVAHSVASLEQVVRKPTREIAGKHPAQGVGLSRPLSIPVVIVGSALVIVMLLGCRDNPPTGPSTPTPTPDPDVTAPLVSLSSPSDEAEVSGTIALMAGASDNVGVAGVQFLIDDEPYGPEVQFGPYRVNFDTRAVVDGSLRQRLGDLTEAVARVVEHGAVAR